MMSRRSRSILDFMEEVEEVQKAAAMGYLDIDDGEDEDNDSSDILEGDIILFDDIVGEVDEDVDEEEEGEEDEDEDGEDEDVVDGEEEFIASSGGLRQSARILGSTLQPLYEEEEDESEPFRSTDEDHQSNAESAQSPDPESGMLYGAAGHANRAQRRSFVVNRRGSVESMESQRSSHSAPPLEDYEDVSASGNFNGRSSFSGPALNNRQGSLTNLFGGARVPGSRRTSNLRASFKSTGSSASGLSEDSLSSEQSGSTPTTTTISSRRASSRRFPRLSQRRNPHRRTDSNNSADQSEFAAAVDKLSSGEDWEQTAAAAAVVASRKGHSVQYSQGDRVLVLLTLLNFTIRQTQPPPGVDDEKTEQIMNSVTIAPVNKAGFPEGEGRTESEKSGPFSYVICTVQQVHFDEIERYYTVVRGDTATQQRAEAAWMEPIMSEDAIQVALRAAKRTASSLSDAIGRDGNKKENVFQAWTNATADHLKQMYEKNRLRAKIWIRKVLQGESGYAFKIRLTGINFLVLCSFTFLFLDVIALAFLSPESDYPVAIVELVVWVILVFELILECLIRPEDYRNMMQSDKAFAPSTARHINTFHVVVESVALILFAPSFRCIWNKDMCGVNVIGPGIRSTLDAHSSSDHAKASLSRLILGLHFLRAFGLIRHWKQVWLKNTFEDDTYNSQIIRRLLLVEKDDQYMDRRNRSIKKTEFEKALEREPHNKPFASRAAKDEDARLKNAATIGTALMVMNSHRFFLLLLLSVTIYPILSTYRYHNAVHQSLGGLLSEYNKRATSTDDCDYLENTVASWLWAASQSYGESRYLLSSEESSFLVWARVQPKRCGWQREDGIITTCEFMQEKPSICSVWETTLDTEPTEEAMARVLGKRSGAFRDFDDDFMTMGVFNGTESLDHFRVTAFFDLSPTVSYSSRGHFFLILALLIQCFVGLTMIRGDARRLVLHPLQRMLKIVVRYAENPLSQGLSSQQKPPKAERGHNLDNDRASPDQLGNFETEQLINAIARIADLLRKCWGVAGAGIISSNLARTEDGKNAVFNPTVPGKRVYALFGFVAINDFGRMLRVLEQDTLVLINDVAKVVHDEVFRWALGDSGQCNKNLGGSFLMVFRIGDFTEVHDRQQRATDVVFESKHRRNLKVRRRAAGKSKGKREFGRQLDISNEGTLQLASLPGIQSFTDRALLGFLKSFAGLNRDYDIQKWRKDFRLGAGVGAFSVSVMFGMDAGWAVEGAVGSEYKIDATYLSPHVNMASRMMSATKQYGVTILLSQAVEKLLSTAARSKLRHLDTVKVKGSNITQKIFTFDARHETVDFFLFERTPDQADAEAEAYTTHVWEVDQDLNAMRQHVSDEFMTTFKEGVDLYIEGRWKKAVEKLQEADDIMIETILESGYVDYDDIDDLSQILNRNNRSEEVERARVELGDGACKCLIQYMKRRNCIPPKEWRGVRALMSK